MKTELEQPKLLPAKEERKEERKIPLRVRAVSDILERHGEWLDSAGEAGIQADLSRENLEGVDLVDARLPEAILNKTVLKRADLILADLRGASLLQANLQEANILGTQFQHANLQAAVLRDATGLASAQLAGSNLFGAVLPGAVSPLEDLKHACRMARQMAWLLATLIVLNLLAWLRIFTTRDAQLLKDAPALPFQGVQADLPFVPFYLFGPVIVLGAYVWFHLYLQRFWDGASQLPAIFPDGRRLDASLPWFTRWPSQTNWKWLKGKRSPLAFLEAGIAILLLYWILPVTTLFFWGRYLTVGDLRGSSVQVAFFVAAVAAAMNFPRMARKAFGARTARPGGEKPSLPPKARASLQKATPLAAGAILFLLSIGIIFGVPHDFAQSAEAGPLQIRSWSAHVLWLAGYNPFPQLTETDISIRPQGWLGRDEDVPRVVGANLNRLRLRYVQGYGAFLVKARLWQADLRNAYLSEADLRGANLRGANLESAILDSARLKNASLQDTNLRDAVLNRSDLRDANVSSATLAGATLLDAKLDGANLYKSDLRSVQLQRASLKQTDLREALLENANLIAANLQGAYLSSTKLITVQMNGADLRQAILEDADLRGSDLSEANLQGAVLRGANLSGVNLQGADLRGASGLTPRQICSAASFVQAQFDENFAQEIAGSCGNSVYQLAPAPQAAPGPASQPGPRFVGPVQPRPKPTN